MADGYCVHFQIEWSRFCEALQAGVILYDTLLSQCLSPPKCISTTKLNSGGSPVMD